MKKRWQPFLKATHFRGGVVNGISSADVRPPGTTETFYVNNLYQVCATRYDNDGGFVHLSFKRQDGSALHDWRDMQRIKNELAGEDWTAVEVFPPEKYLIDSANQWHLWCFRNLELPFMWKERMVSEVSPGRHGSQRPWPEDEKPPDLKTAEDFRIMCAVLKQQKEEKQRDHKS